MIYLILEGVFALLLFVFIIWWTLPRRRDKDPHSPQRHRDTENDK